MPTVLILGAASDIAVVIAHKFGSEKYDLQLAARNSDRLETLLSDLTIRYGIQVSLLEFDALDYHSHGSFVNTLKVVPDITVCVFGYLGENELSLNDWSECSKVIATNYIGAVSVLNKIAMVYKVQKRGMIIGISSVAGERGRSSNYIYGSAKSGFTTYLSGLRNNLFHHGVHVMTVLPGFVNTSMTEGMKLPPLLTAQPAEVAKAVYDGAISKKNIIYIKWFWRWIMLVIVSIPEFIFKKLKL